ncbi:hypothetical protein TNIN_432271 [Trichonephila inaurata madagascariensis]|uniref:Uncharacterized protein n=1 Tax=Trichonephila inaurata madagascariensis TaxID=2747483 RepID=A0A8X6XTE2_9ARAC|nr:hypothetical protein TNIN_446141 [Trichonephila inaurata madagascariensis]GFY58330.1 hypothetical protein TNIN_432271 [Trichonephila inaurata madagascariensis]
MEADNIDCALVQEPHSYRSSLPGYPSTYRLFYDPISDIIKAAIIVRSSHLSTFIDYKNTDYNIVTLEVITGSTAFTLFSYYFEPSKTLTRIFIKSAKFLVAKISIDWSGAWTPIANQNYGLVPTQMHEIS